jgi:hypothetical protein
MTVNNNNKTRKVNQMSARKNKSETPDKAGVGRPRVKVSIPSRKFTFAKFAGHNGATDENGNELPKDQRQICLLTPMGNTATIQRTAFVNIPDGEKTFGYRIYDDYEQDYDNIFEEADMNLPDKDFLLKVVGRLSEVGQSIFDLALDKGVIEIDGKICELVRKDGTWELVSPE